MEHQKLMAGKLNHVHLQSQITLYKYDFNHSCTLPLIEFLRWPTTVTSKPNVHSKLQIAHSKLQIAHSKFKSLTANYKSLTANYKSLTANSNRSQQIEVAHSKFKLLTANYKLLTPVGVFGYLQPAEQLV